MRLKTYFTALTGTIALVGLFGAAETAAESGKAQSKAQMTVSSSDAAPIYGITIPPGYRDWGLISVDRLQGGPVKQVRAQLGNDIALKALREGKLPLPDGAIVAALHWNEVVSDENNKVLAAGFPGAGLQSFVAGSPVNIQFMVKDSRKYASTGGWGFADFTDGKPGSEALHKTCFSCHLP